MKRRICLLSRQRQWVPRLAVGMLVALFLVDTAAAQGGLRVRRFGRVMAARANGFRMGYYGPAFFPPVPPSPDASLAPLIGVRLRVFPPQAGFYPPPFAAGVASVVSSPDPNYLRRVHQGRRLPSSAAEQQELGGPTLRSPTNTVEPPAESLPPPPGELDDSRVRQRADQTKRGIGREF